jgi:uncharacterized repeat protein (TIGR01451 family)
LQASLAGTTPGGGHDQLRVTHSAALAGTLALTADPPPSVGDAFTVVDANTASGAFTTVTGRQPGGGVVLRVTYPGTGAVVDTHPLPVLSATPASVFEPATGTTTLTFEITLTPTPPDVDVPDTVTVDYATQNGSAVAPDDYLATSGTLTFVPGDTSETVTVTVNSDAVLDGDETFTLELSDPQFATLATTSVTGTIIAAADLEVAITVPSAVTQSITFPATYTATNHGGANATGVVVSAPVPAGWTFVAAGSSAGCSGSTTVTCNIGSLGAGASTTRTLRLSPFTNPGPYSLTATITGNEVDPDTGNNSAQLDVDLAPLRLEIGDTTIYEGDSTKRTVIFPVTLSLPANRLVTASYAIVADTADASDVLVKTGTVKFPTTAKGVTAIRKTIAATILPDTGAESDETYHVVLSNVVGATGTRTTGTGTILDDDVAAGVRVAISSLTMSEGDPTAKRPMTFRVTLSQKTTAPVTVKVRVVPGTAIVGRDYQLFKEKLVTFNAGQFVKSVSIGALPNLVDDGDRQFTVELFDVNGASPQGTGIGTGTILDDD